MTASDRDRRHRWAETCEKVEKMLNAEWGNMSTWADDLREIAAYLRADDTPTPSSAKEEG